MPVTTESERQACRGGSSPLKLLKNMRLLPGVALDALLD
jgi:hypothetical protein